MLIVKQGNNKHACWLINHTLKPFLKLLTDEPETTVDGKLFQ